jgi:rubrerythrin
MKPVVMEVWAVDELKHIDDILDFAIRQEEEAAEFYTDLASRVERSETRAMFLQFADEERSHKAKLLSLKASRSLARDAGEVKDLRIGDYLVDVDVTTDITYQDALIVAMKREKSAFRLYSGLAAKTRDEAIREMLLFLANEEARHKLRFEIEYDEHVSNEN